MRTINSLAKIGSQMAHFTKMLKENDYSRYRVMTL